MASDPQGPLGFFHLGLDGGADRLPDCANGIGEPLMEAGANPGGCQIGSQAALGHDEQVHGVGQQPVLEPFDPGGGFGATESHDNVAVIQAHPGLRVANTDEFRLEAQLVAVFLLAFPGGKVGNIGSHRQETGVGGITEGVFMQGEGHAEFSWE